MEVHLRSVNRARDGHGVVGLDVLAARHDGVAYACKEEPGLALMKSAMQLKEVRASEHVLPAAGQLSEPVLCRAVAFTEKGLL